jgi:hypothetical protein
MSSFSQLCQLCDDAHPACFRCIDCGENMCEIVGKSHSRAKISRDHKVVPLTNDTPDISGEKSALDDEWLRLVKTVICPVHNDEFKYYDETCGQAICRDCYVLNHHGHKCTSITEASTDFRTRLDSKCQEVKSQIDSGKFAEKNILIMKDKVDKRYQEVAKERGDVFDKVSADDPP